MLQIHCRSVHDVAILLHVLQRMDSGTEDHAYRLHEGGVVGGFFRQSGCYRCYDGVGVVLVLLLAMGTLEKVV